MFNFFEKTGHEHNLVLTFILVYVNILVAADYQLYLNSVNNLLVKSVPSSFDILYSSKLTIVIINTSSPHLWINAHIAKRLRWSYFLSHYIFFCRFIFSCVPSLRAATANNMCLLLSIDIISCIRNNWLLFKCWCKGEYKIIEYPFTKL